ncbi:reverse transcriptase domain-containing protein [Tanacetum coccineum]
MFTGGSSCVDGSGARLILTSPEGTEFTYALRFQFTASNNEAEYEALIAGLWIAAQMGVRNVHGIDIAGPFPEGTGKVKFLIVAMDYFIKWIETKAVATISGSQAHRMMIKSSNDDTPFSLTYGTEAVIPAKIGMPMYRTAVVDAIHNDEELRLNLDLLEERRERTAIHEAKAKLNMTKFYNARVRGVTFRPGDFVYRSNDASHVVDGGKLGPKWEGPYEVAEALGNGAYKLRSTDETILPRT